MEPEHEESEDCWCLPHIEPVKTEEGSINYVIVHNRITDEPRRIMDTDEQFIFELTNVHTRNPNILWEFTLIGDTAVIGSVINWILMPNGIPMTIAIQVKELDRKLEIPWTAICHIEFKGPK